MSVSAVEHWFSPVIRRNRKSYIWATIFLTAIMASVVLFLWFTSLVSTNAGALIFLAFFIPYFICGYFLTAQRLRDIGISGWLALLWIPVGIADSHLEGAAALSFYIVLAALPGTKGENRYGPDPLSET